MKKNITLKELQELIKSKDHKPELKHAYFLKLIEEVGELGEVIRKIDFEDMKLRYEETGSIKGTLEEELSDVLYYILAIANVNNIDMEECFRLKEKFNSIR